MKSKSAIIILSLLFGALFSCIVCAMLGFVVIKMTVIGDIFHSHPSEEWLISNFNDHEDEFMRLIDDLAHDRQKGLKRIGDTWTDPSDPESIGISEQKIADYRETFEKLGVRSTVYLFDDHYIFAASPSGLSVSGSSKGYYYSEAEPQNYFKEGCGKSTKPVESIDTFENCVGGHSYVIYQHIKGNWYLYYEYED